MPSPLYRDIIRPQFADDVLIIVRSDIKGRNKYENVLKKLQDELNKLLKWDQDWKIKVNPNKSLVGSTPTAIPHLEIRGGININGAPLRITSNIKIQGYNFNFKFFSTNQVNTITKKASYSISKLYRFRSAPTKMKKHLYLALIRPLLEHPSSQLNNCGISNTKKLQHMQNKGTYFINDVQKIDRISSRDLHARLKLDTMNVCINKLNRKLMYKIHEIYYANDDFLSQHINCFSDFVIEEQPVKEKVIH